MRNKIEILKDKKINEKKRKNQREFNYINNYDKIEKLEFQEIKNRYIDILKEFEKSKLFYNKDYSIYKFEFEKSIIIIRDEIEKSFFFNKFINEYLDYNNNLKKEEKISFEKFIIEISNFLIFDNKKYIILDIEKDYKNK